MSRADDRPANGAAVELRIAVICLFPDFGHAQRLLRVAAALADGGCAVRAFMPAETRPLFSRYDLDIVALGESDAKAGRFLLDRQFAGSLFFQRFSAFTHHALFVSGFVFPACPGHAAVLQNELSAFAPTLLICDAWHFRDLYRRVAQSRGVHVIFHESGTLGYLQRPYVQAFGLTEHPEGWKRFVEALGQLAGPGFKALLVARYVALWRRGKRARAAAIQAFNDNFPVRAGHAVREIELTNGFSNLERAVDHPDFRHQGSARIDLDPTPLVSKTGGLDLELARWLEGLGERSLVYVNFGSIVRLNARLANALYGALIAVGRPVLWSIPVRQRRLIQGLDPLGSVRFADYVDQLELLRNDKVALVVCHGGGNTMQESASSGRPMLCLPFFADHPFNASIVARLGIGRMLKPASATRAVLERALLDMLNDETLAQSSARFAEAFNRRDGSSELLRVVREHVAGPSAAGDPPEVDAERKANRMVAWKPSPSRSAAPTSPAP